MKVEVFKKYEFYTGVPDSLLNPFCKWVNTVRSDSHIVAANEGNAVAIAAGYHLATGKIPVVYMQNSGIGNIVNPVVSLTNPKIYGIPMLFLIGWRGEPSVADEPQHLFQGEITLRILEDMGIKTYVVSKDTTEEDFFKAEAVFQQEFEQGRSAAFVIRKNALQYDGSYSCKNDYTLVREEIIKSIVGVAGKDIIVSTTGKTSRELFEIRKSLGQDGCQDFLTVGSMGHSSSIALGIAMNRPKRRVWIIDGDGAALMHMGAMATIGASGLRNVVHVVINNASHESVGEMPTVADKIDFCKIAEGCGYPIVKSACNPADLTVALNSAVNEKHLTFLEVKSAVGSRSDLGRPTSSPEENKKRLIEYLDNEN